MELTRKKSKSHTVEKSRDRVLATKEALNGGQKSSPEADNPMTKDERSSPEKNFTLGKNLSKQKGKSTNLTNLA